ncbi:pimeloyl-ACP methyl ester esterase BioH [Xylella taiwanensis]|uniref:Pimeloyl-[acyl-carrier protein] methyl ester esterase n=1 Tax=Xylella taiwanensis TaxID=1444770 RepID=Z9JG76_9GAMM|nr:pimeloyl-ACP methyl ester esterase BioH [Xylella taiwanensis]AXI83152.1 pimelyl-ACP methyl ester esterase [Xylella taiwanensis]EWS77184.1 pimelyl-ACP methyl ester esterase [Xylella taiwanensis]MCD8456201.1 pimeloyl-ACP methyl ester esterase BioH [Xylella taiwanensis]MCD8458610.1 pimeloyl-ACP methyl ester esterase BioH [Xylella taiwanensis]MCD8460744.1 pimeloyl-ACP methyl ester esterase BioH [Xylella taiwanensis]
MHIEVTGHGPALVLIHGWALHSGVFIPLVEQLADHHTLYLVDLPGHGHSHTTPTPLALPHVVRAIAAATPPAVWLGWSLGGLFALHAAATLPQVRGLVMLAATPCFIRRKDWPHAVEANVFAQFGQDLKQNYTDTINRFLTLNTLGSTHGHTELRQLQHILNTRNTSNPATLQTGLDLLERTDLRRAVIDLTRPSLWIAGQQDRLAPTASLHAATALAPRGQTELLTIAGSGHAPFLKHANQIAAALRHFIATIH